MPLITRERSIIPACDVDLVLYEKILQATCKMDAIGAYKIGFQLGLAHGLSEIVEITRQYTQKPLIYDHQKAGTDTPHTAGKFMAIMKNAGINAVILFHQAGPATEEAWIKAAFYSDLGVIVGGAMTHASYARSEGGYIADEAIMEMYTLAAKLGVKDFVVPGTKPSVITTVKELLDSPTFYAPGFGAQGGDISQAVKASGGRLHAIVGQDIYKSSNIAQTIDNLSRQMSL